METVKIQIHYTETVMMAISNIYDENICHSYILLVYNFPDQYQ